MPFDFRKFFYKFSNGKCLINFIGAKMKLKMLLILSIAGSCAQSYSMDSIKSWAKKNQDELTSAARGFVGGFSAPLLLTAIDKNRSFSENRKNGLVCALGIANGINLFSPADKGKFKRLLFASLGFALGVAYQQ
jgi:hypothetical protein